jgi:hypothetical protein
MAGKKVLKEYLVTLSMKCYSPTYSLEDLEHIIRVFNEVQGESAKITITKTKEKNHEIPSV